MPSPRPCPLACALILVAAVAGAQPAADPAAETTPTVVALQSELARLRLEIDALRAALAGIQEAIGARPASTLPPELTARSSPSVAGSADDARRASTQGPGGVAAGMAAAPAAQATSLPQDPRVSPEQLEMIRAQLEEHAQTKVETASRLPVKLSGTILTNTYVNSGEANWLENPGTVIAPAAGAESRGSMSATARQSRLGLDARGIQVGAWEVSATLIADFFGGTPGFRTGPAMGLPRLLYAFGRIETDRTAIEIGQDHVLVAPRDPTSLAAFSFPLLFRSGNLYLRAPQARLEQKLNSEWTVAVGILSPMAGDAAGTFEFSPPAGAGERSMRPAFQSRVSFDRGTGESSRQIAAGVGGQYGWRRNGVVQSDAWAVAADLDIRAGRVGAAGEWYAAYNAESLGGGIAQPGRAYGGWAEGRLAVTPRTTMAGGFGLDRPHNALGRVARVQNRTAFGSVIVQLTPEVSTSVEYRWIETRMGLVPVAAANHHVNAVFAVKF